MKVAFLLCSETIGGHEFQSVEFAVSSKQYCEPVVFLNIPEHQKLIENRDIDYILSPEKFFENGNFLKQYSNVRNKRKVLTSLLSGFDIIIICAGTSEAGISSAYALRNREKTFLYVPMFVDRRELWGPIGAIYNILLKCFIKPYNGVVTITEAQGRIFRKYKSVIILPNKIASSDKPIEKNHQLQDRRLYFVGRLDRQKKIPELINWLDSPLNPIREFVIVGKGEKEDIIINKISKLKYITVTLRGWMTLDEQNMEFTSNDIFIINSAYEGKPLVIREANNRGSVVIASDIIGHQSCTYPENRYRDQKTMISLIIKASKGELHRYINQSLDEIEALRKKALERLYM